MTSKEQVSVMLDLIAELKSHGSWTGETHVQKATYLLQELLGLPAEFEFVLYKHGPFSFDLRECLEQMEAGRLIELHEQRYPYGPKFAEGAAATSFHTTTQTPERFVGGISFISKELAGSGVAELERVATALYVRLDSGVKPEDRASKLVELKPHIQMQDANMAFKRLDEIRNAAINEGFSPVI